jgi:hypothetical protein
MRFDLSDTQTAFADALKRGLEDVEAGQAETLDRRLFDLGAGSSLRAYDEDGEVAPGLLPLALAAEAAGRSLAPWTALHGALGAWLLDRAGAADPAIARLADDFAEGRQTLLHASGDQATRLVDGDPLVSHVAWQTPAGLALYPPGSTVSQSEERADRTRPVFRIAAPSGPPILTTGHADEVRDALRILRAADAFGAAGKAFEMTCDYVKVRRQFGRPIGAFQAVRHQLADLARDLYPCRFLIWRAAHFWGMADGERQAALTKAHVCDVAVAVTRATVELHGAIGFTEDYPLHLYVKRAAENRSRDGLSPALRERVAILSGW